MEIRNDWLAQVTEEIVDPERPIVDPHHHFFVETELFPHYEVADLWADASGHNVVQTVFAQCGECYRTDGPEALKPVGETEWVEGLAQQTEKAPGKPTIGAIFGTAKLSLGEGVREVLEAHVAASPRFVGIREVAVWDASPEVQSNEELSGPDLYADPDFRTGLRVLGDMGLTYDAYPLGRRKTPRQSATQRRPCCRCSQRLDSQTDANESRAACDNVARHHPWCSGTHSIRDSF